MPAPSAAAVDQNDPLPRCKGPQTRRFHHRGKIQFQKFLGPDAKDKSPSAAHGYVFQVVINRRPFALKIFKFFNSADVRDQLFDSQRKKLSDKIITDHLDPFYAECRAYGRIKSKSRKRDIAVPCHGYVPVPADEEPNLLRRFQVSEWDRPEDEYSLDIASRQPFRALVKDLVLEDPPLSAALLKDMREDIIALNKSGVYVMDVVERNYKGGLLVDFGAAWTTPHCMMKIHSARVLKTYLESDMHSFNYLVRKSGVKLDESILIGPNPEFKNKLRRRTKTINYKT